MTEGNFESKAGIPQYVRFKPNAESTLAYLAYYDSNNVLQKVYFYVNPSRMSYTYRQKTTRRRTRAGWVEEYWGEEMDAIAVEAVTGGFKSTSAGYGSFIATGSENTAFSRLEELIKAYRLGGLSFSSTFPESFAPVQLHFDKFVYYGFFENFNVEDSAERPFMMSFSFSFKVLGTDVLF